MKNSRFHPKNYVSNIFYTKLNSYWSCGWKFSNFCELKWFFSYLSMFIKYILSRTLKFSYKLIKILTIFKLLVKIYMIKSIKSLQKNFLQMWIWNEKLWFLMNKNQVKSKFNEMEICSKINHIKFIGKYSKWLKSSSKNSYFPDLWFAVLFCKFEFKFQKYTHMRADNWWISCWGHEHEWVFVAL